jgi:F0F1-type ATP synthase membrane subunit b/b'
MPDKQEKLSNEPMVDLDTSGPGARVELPETEKEADKTYENEVKKDEPNITYDDQPDNASEKSDEQPVVRDEKNEGGEVTQKADEEKSDKPQDNTQAVEEYSEGVKKRIAKLTKKMREAERQKEEALRYAHSVKQERDQFQTQATSLDKNYATEMEGRISSSIAAAQAKLAAARQNEDSKAEVEALTAISQLGYEQGKLAELKTQHQMQETAAKEEPVQPTRQPMQQAPARDPKAEAWAEENEWFGKDNAMTYTAFDLHRKLTEEEGMDPQSDDYYKEVDRRIRLEFPHKFDRPVEEKQTTKPTQNVASATRSTKSGRKQVRLTSSQVAIARKLGVPLEEYAKQLINTKEV